MKIKTSLFIGFSCLLLSSYTVAAGTGQNGSTVQNPQIFHYTFQLQGSKVGTNVLTESKDGTFNSESHLTIGPREITSILSGKMVNHRIVSYKLVGDVNKDHVVLVWDGKQLSATQGGKTKLLPYVDKSLAWFSNFHLVTQESLSQVKFNGEAKSIKGSLYLAENAIVTGFTLTKQDSKPYNLSATKKIASHYIVDLTSVKIDTYLDDNGQVVAEDVGSQQFRIVRDGVSDMFTDPLSKFPELSQPTYQTKVIKNLVCKTRDGVDLIADAVVPDAPGTFPVILERTPYDRTVSLLGGAFYASRGYAFVAQDVRGTGESKGEWDPFVHERKDGYDTVQWVAGQPWSNGKVGMIGGSYLGLVQWAAAVEKPPALLCMVPQVSPPDALSNLPYENGTLLLFGDLWWANIVKSGKADMALASAPPKNINGLLDLPLTKVPEATLGAKVPFFAKWLERDGMDKWKGFDFEKDLLNVNIPTLNISGWWDGDGIGTDMHWLAMRKAKRTNQWLIEGPWIHAFNTTSSLGEDNYGPQAIIDLDSIYLRWFDTWLKGKNVGWDAQPKVKYFAMVQNKWHFTSDFPDPLAKKTVLSLGAGHSLGGTLSQGSDSYIYDPSKAVVTDSLKKSLLDPPKTISITHDPKDKTSLLYQTTPMKKSIIMEGPFGVDLSFKITTVTTDLYAILLDVDQKGRMIPLSAAGKLNLSYLKGLDKPRKLIPGMTYHAHLFPWMSAREIKVGHKIGLMIVSSIFPGTARNLNTGDPILTATKMAPVRVTIFHDPAHPSSISFYSLQS